jgi:hypothetical protein
VGETIFSTLARRKSLQSLQRSRVKTITLTTSQVIALIIPLCQNHDRRSRLKNMNKLTNISATRSTQNSFDRSFIEAHDGTRLFDRDWGTGKPVVFVHGWGLGAAMWEYQTIANSFYFTRTDAMGHRTCSTSIPKSHD